MYVIVANRTHDPAIGTVAARTFDSQSFMRHPTEIAVALIALTIAFPFNPVLAQTDAPAVQSGSAPALTGGTIQAIRVEGAQRIEAETIDSYLTVQPGEIVVLSTIKAE